MRCNQCGNENNSSAKFCSSCGEALVLSCPQCSSSLGHGHAFCSQCGYSIKQLCQSCGQQNPHQNTFCFGCGASLQNCCPQCEVRNPKNSRFCGGCSARLTMECEGCGFVNLPGQKFCGNCQKQLIPGTEFQKLSSTSSPLPRPLTPTGPPNKPQKLEPEYLLSEALEEEEVQAPVNETLSQKTSDEDLQLERMDSQEIMKSVEVEPIEIVTGEASSYAIEPKEYVAEEQKESNFVLVPKLEEFALVSIELMNLPKPQGDEEKHAIEQFMQDCIHMVEERVTAFGGIIESVNRHVLFVSFPHEESTKISLHKGIQTSLSLLEEKYHQSGFEMKLRVGMDIENPHNKSPMLSTAERTIAPVGALVLSPYAYSLVEEAFEMEAIGPLRLGNRMVTFYQVLRPLCVDSLVSTLPPQESATPERGYDISPQEGIHQDDETLFSHSQVIEGVSFEEKEILYTPPTLRLMGSPREGCYSYEESYEVLLDELQKALSEGVQGKGKIISFSAPSGFGKSSITRMVLGQLSPTPQEASAFWLMTHSFQHFFHDHDAGIPLQFWLEMFQTSFGLVMEGSNKEEARQLIHQSLQYLYGDHLSQEVQQFFEEFLSVGELAPIHLQSKENLGRIQHNLNAFLSVLAVKKPVVVLLEDLEYADIASLDLLARLLKGGLLEHPVHLVLTHEPAFYLDGELSQCLQMLPYKEVVARVLMDEEARNFLKMGPLNGTYDTFPQPILSQLVHNAKGLPLYFVEALRLLHLQGIMELKKIAMDEGEVEKFAVAPPYLASPGQVLVPTSLEEIISNRLKYLSDMARYTLQLASILGEKFALGALMSLSGSMEEAQFGQLLKELFEHGWIIPDPVNTARFAHRMLWHTVYQSLNQDMREQLHKLVSEYLETALNQNFAVNPSLIAFHAHKGKLPNRAFHYWNLAGVHAAQLGSLVAVNEMMFKAMALLPKLNTEEAEKWESQICENIGILNSEDYPELALPLLEKAEANARKTQHVVKSVEIMGFLASCHERNGHYYEAHEYLEKALSLFSKEEYPLEFAAMLSNQLEYLYTIGKLEQGLKLFNQQIEPIYALNEVQPDSIHDKSYLKSKLIKANCLLWQCDKEAFGLLEQLHHVAKERHLIDFDIQLKLALSEGFLLKGNYSSCQRSLEAVLNQIETLQNPERYLAQWGKIALAYHCEIGDWESASLLVPNTLFQAEKSKDYATWLMVTTYTGWVALGQGNLGEAREALEKAITLSSEYRFATSAIEGWRLLAETKLKIGSLSVAEEIAARALEVAQKPEIHNLLEIYRLSNVKAQCLLAQGEVKKGGAVLEPIWPKVVQSGFLPLIAQTAFQIGALYQAMGSGAMKEDGRKRYYQNAYEFLNKAKSIWKDMGNTYQLNQVEKIVSLVR